MGRCYGQLSQDERLEIFRLHAGGRSIRGIAADLGRSASTISRELVRNSRPTKAWPRGDYDPVRAQARAERRRRWDGRFKLARQPDLQRRIRDLLAMGWSPEQIAGRLALEQGRCVVSYESIYRFVYHRSAQKDYWHKLLPRRKSRRGRLGRRGGSPASFIRDRRPIAQRPPEVQDRRQPGHWEADLMLFARYGQAVLVRHERHSRLIVMTRQPSKAAQPTAEALLQTFQTLPAELRRSCTFDNGTEFAQHWRLAGIQMQTFFCDPHKPWQKGGVENAIGRLRRDLPRKTDLATCCETKLNNLVKAYNNTPRKCLAFRTPAEVFLETLKPLHFNRECTFPPARE